MMSDQISSYVLEGLTKNFPGVCAVKNVDLEVKCGEIHGIIGRNGAGKSVLVNMISGILVPTSGKIKLQNGEINAQNSSPIIARKLGVSLIPQEPKFARELSVLDNMFMGCYLTNSSGFLRPKQMAEKIVEICKRLQVDVKPSDKMGDLPIESQQMLAFGKAVYIDQSSVILLDEITASLTQERKSMLLKLLREIASERQNLSFTLISHHISEILEFTDRVTVMRDGERVATLETKGCSKADLANWIVGDTPKVKIDFPKASKENKNQILLTDNLCNKGTIEGLNLSIKVGDVIGFAGLEGSGKDAAIEMLFGLRKPSNGTIAINGTVTTLDSPQHALDHNVAYLPKHREAEAVIPNRSVAENTLISSYALFSNRLGLIDVKKSRAEVTKRTEKLKIKTPSIYSNINNLSGGNKQKVMINRLALTLPALFLLNEPTRGVDISAKPPLLKVIREELAKESGVIMISESEEELVEVCDRVLVFLKGRIVQDIKRGHKDFNVGTIYRLAQGVDQ